MYNKEVESTSRIATLAKVCFNVDSLRPFEPAPSLLCKSRHQYPLLSFHYTLICTLSGHLIDANT